jgi:hypothetical protein
VTEAPDMVTAGPGSTHEQSQALAGLSRSSGTPAEAARAILERFPTAVLVRLEQPEDRATKEKQDVAHDNKFREPFCSPVAVDIIYRGVSLRPSEICRLEATMYPHAIAAPQIPRSEARTGGGLTNPPHPDFDLF